MHRRDFVATMFASAGLPVVYRVSSQQQPIEPDLAKLAEHNGFKGLQSQRNQPH